MELTRNVGYDRANLHWETDPEAIVYANRYAIAIDAALFAGTTGTPPRLVAATLQGTELTLTYDRDLETAVSYTANAWTFDDDGSAITVTAAAKQGDRGVVLTLATAPASSTLSVYLGSSNAAAGDDVPRGLGGQAALPGMKLVSSGSLSGESSLVVGRPVASNVGGQITDTRFTVLY